MCAHMNETHAHYYIIILYNEYINEHEYTKYSQYSSIRIIFILTIILNIKIGVLNT